MQQHLKQQKRVHDRQNDSLKLAKQVNKLECSYYRQGRMKTLFKNRIPGITHMLQFD
jgi:hypothetical protein